uniref:Uncharacterized protein n=1 Tax=candidate division WWE3 bacterium TaxID=2053526 RepID=A0A7C4TQV2_UNCKA
MKHVLSNLSLMVLLIAMLAVPISGFYMFDYSETSSSGNGIPSYVPIKITGDSPKVLSEQNSREEANKVAETELSVESTGESEETTTSESNPAGFDPVQYAPAASY